MKVQPENYGEVIYHYVTTEEYRKECEKKWTTPADEYKITKKDEADFGIIVWSKHHGAWHHCSDCKPVLAKILGIVPEL